jgi:serine protease Do
MNISSRKIILAITALWLILPTAGPHSETGYSWPRTTVEKCVKTTSVFFVTYPQGSFLGSGVLVSKTGRVLTAAHLFNPSNYTSIKMVTWNGEEYDAKVLAINTRIDLALVEPVASAQNFVFSPIQRSNKLYVGEDILIVGHPHGQFWTVTTGIISRLPFLVSYFATMIETDALVNPGNSGGPAFNTKGEIIGILSAKYIQSGIGIVVPINEIHYFLRAYEMKKKPDTQIKRYRIGDVK